MDRHKDSVTVLLEKDAADDRGLAAPIRGRHVLVVLELKSPTPTGPELVRRLEAVCLSPLLMLTTDEVDAPAGGVGPFSAAELTALLSRVQGLVDAAARSEAADRGPGPVLSVDDVVLDLQARTMRRGGSPLAVTAVEFVLLRLFLASPGRVLAREELFRHVLGREPSAFDRSIDNHVSSLRKKLGPRPDGGPRFQSVRGHGYVYLCAESRPPREGAV
jgi:two-component system, OmpR family, response regulator CpxR